MAGSNVSARWEGQVEAPVSGSYNFNIRTDDGVRLWLNNQQRVNDYGNYPPTDHNFTVNLTAGQKYNLKTEWKQGGGGYEAKFFWSYPGQGNQIVPGLSVIFWQRRWGLHATQRAQYFGQSK